MPSAIALSAQVLTLMIASRIACFVEASSGSRLEFRFLHDSSALRRAAFFKGSLSGVTILASSSNSRTAFASLTNEVVLSVHIRCHTRSRTLGSSCAGTHPSKLQPALLLTFQFVVHSQLGPGKSTCSSPATCSPVRTTTTASMTAAPPSAGLRFLSTTTSHLTSSLGVSRLAIESDRATFPYTPLLPPVSSRSKQTNRVLHLLVCQQHCSFGPCRSPCGSF
mmetsp:Transcript_3141/g.5287  ORF Transcript_3141/g.5287 Transcript_3141/m.5287 type:complete len:222 (+) Transcript_3141:1985-2650(+)